MNKSSCVPDQIGILGNIFLAWGVGLGVVGVLRKGVREEPGCLPFTGANRLVHGLGKGDAKFRTGKCRPGIAYTICTNQLHSPKNDREDLKLVSTMAFNK